MSELISESNVATNVAENTSVVNTSIILLNRPNLQQELIDSLADIPENWLLVPVNADKVPCTITGKPKSAWQDNILTRQALIDAIANPKSKITGYGLLTGEKSGNILAIDADGQAAEDLLQSLSAGDLPDTVAFSSGLPGRSQRLYVIPDCYEDQIKTTRLNTGVKYRNANGKEKDVLLEFRFNGAQSVLPPSVHPVTGSYKWVRSPQEVEVAACPYWLLELLLKDEQTNQNRIGNLNTAKAEVEALEFPIAFEVDIIDCLSRANREILNGGCDEGRNNAGLKLARDLIGLQDFFESVDQSYTGDIEKIFFDWCTQVGLDQDTPTNQPTTIWESAQKSNPEPAIRDYDVIKNIIGWKFLKSQKEAKKQAIVEQNKAQQNTEELTETTDNNSKKQSKTEVKISASELGDLIADFLLSSPNETSIILEKSRVISEYGLNFKYVDDIFKQIEDDLDRQATIEDAVKELERLEKTPEDLDVSMFLPQAIATSFKTLSEEMGVPQMAFAASLLPCVASLIDRKLTVKVKNGWREHLHIWTALNAPSGSKKTAIIKTCLSQIKRLEADEHARYKEAVTQYEMDLQQYEYQKKQGVVDESFLIKPTEPLRRDFYLQKSTMEKITLTVTEQDYPFVIYRDELVGFFNGLGQYKSGKSDDVETFLEFYDGTGGKNSTVSKTVQFSIVGGLSLVGGTQPTILAKLLANNQDSQGLWARHDIVSFNDKTIKMALDDGEYLADEQIYKLYQNVMNFGNSADLECLTLDIEAKKLFVSYKFTIDNLKDKEQKEGLRTALAKIPGKVARYAGILHIIDCASRGVINSIITLQTVANAIKLCNFYYQHIALIYAQNGLSDTVVAPDMLKVIKFLDKAPDKTRSIRDIQAFCLQARKAAYIKEICDQLLTMERVQIKNKPGTKTKLVTLLEEIDKKS